jgi:phage replication O-like protein O
MASPQIENGFLKIANEIVEALARTNLSAYQARVLWVIFRKTYGFGKKEDWISNSQMVESTGLHKAHISRTVRDLADRNIVIKRGNKIGFQKDYQQWRELPKGVTSHEKLPIQATLLPIGVTPVTKRGGHKRKYTKDTLQKTQPESFQAFYGAFPKKKARAAAEKAWAKVNPSPELFKTIMASLEEQKQSADWLKNNGQFIPFGSTWLNGRRWEDDVSKSNLETPSGLKEHSLLKILKEEGKENDLQEMSERDPL